jgi:hypothetical protein
VDHPEPWLNDIAFEATARGRGHAVIEQGEH